jgi:hypothetical protein
MNTRHTMYKTDDSPVHKLSNEKATIKRECLW